VVEQRFCKPSVVGSNPTTGSILKELQPKGLAKQPLEQVLKRVLISALAQDGNGRGAVCPDKHCFDAGQGEALEMLGLSARENALRVQTHPVPFARIVNVGQFALGIDGLGLVDGSCFRTTRNFKGSLKRPLPW
jgi:hypothetical protein